MIEGETEFLPIVRSGAWTDVGIRSSMEDVYVCVDDFTNQYGLERISEGPNAFYGVSLCLFLFFFFYLFLGAFVWGRVFCSVFPL